MRVTASCSLVRSGRARHELLELTLPLLKDNGGKLFLTFQKLLVLLVEVVFGTFQFGVILGAQVGQILLHHFILGHGAQHLVVAEIAKAHLCPCHKGKEKAQ